jgi:hypothetical protein
MLASVREKQTAPTRCALLGRLPNRQNTKSSVGTECKTYDRDCPLIIQTTYGSHRGRRVLAVGQSAKHAALAPGAADAPRFGQSLCCSSSCTACSSSSFASAILSWTKAAARTLKAMLPEKRGVRGVERPSPHRHHDGGCQVQSWPIPQ